MSCFTAGQPLTKSVYKQLTNKRVWIYQFYKYNLQMMKLIQLILANLLTYSAYLTSACPFASDLPQWFVQFQRGVVKG